MCVSEGKVSDTGTDKGNEEEEDEGRAREHDDSTGER